MAQPLRRPLCVVTDIHSRPSFHTSISRRCLSTTPRYHKIVQKNATGQYAGVKKTSQPSLKVLQKTQAQVPRDVGLLPQTFITPRGPNRPSLLKEPKTYFWLLYRHAFSRLRDRMSLIILKFSSPKEGKGMFKRKFKIQRSGITSAAIGLHHQMYTAFADGDVSTIRNICADGIRDTLLARIGQRAKDETVTWEVVRMKGRKLISDKAARLPAQLGDGAAIRQAVVRIKSVQRLTRMRGGKVVGNSGKEREVEEYVVVQKRMTAWTEGEWFLWGTTKETTAEKLREEIEAAES